MVQALMQKALGNNSLIFGAGADGAREMVYEGEASFPSNVNKWKGYWVVQAKYKTKEEDINDYAWIEKQFKFEMSKFSKKGYKKPENYIFLTNATLTPMLTVGGRDKIELLKEEYKSLIPNIFIGGYDEICSFLDNNRDVATSFSSFILSGDVLDQVLKFYKRREDDVINDSIKTIKLFLEKEFRIEQTSKLIQAGDLAHTVNLENVFIDLLVTGERKDFNKQDKVYAVNYVVKQGNLKQNCKNKKEKIVFIGGAGAGKSTITQFACQLYTAYFLKKVCNRNNSIIDDFIRESEKLRIEEPTCYRVPIKIVLKDYAGWINDQGKNDSISVLNYIKFRINLETGNDIDVDIIRQLFEKVSFLFVFDGLDEVPISSNRNLVIGEINSFVEVELDSAQCDSVVLATTRPQGYSKEFDKDKYRHFYVEDMTDEICLTYLGKLLKNIESSAEKNRSYLTTLKKALSNEVTGNLMRTPLQATIMAILVVSGGETSANKYELFRDYYDTIFKREKQKKVSSLINNFENQINKIHNYLGYKLQYDSENSSNSYSYISKKEFESLVITYLKQEEWENEDIKRFIDEFKKTLIHRLVFITEVQDDKVGFVIRSLQEFFAANYLMDTNDIQVIERIKGISTNSYWRNTLLFSVGNIRIKKDYLVDEVFTICQELNGLGLWPGENNTNSIAKIGSWLALDILTEGIVDDMPKLTNKFAVLLEPLIIMPFGTDHYKFNRLQQKVKENWLLNKFLKKIDATTLTPSQQRTFFYVLISVLDVYQNKALRSKIYLMIEKNQDITTIEKIIEQLYNASYIDSSFCKFFFIGLKKLPKLTLASYLYDTLDKDNDNKQFYKVLLRNIKDDFSIKSLIIENLLFSAINDSSPEIDRNEFYKVISKLSGKKFKYKKVNLDNVWGVFGDFFKEENVILHKGIYAIYYGIDKVNKDIIDQLYNIRREFKLSYLTQYFEYQKNPSCNSIKNLFQSSQLLNEDQKQYIFDGVNDWYLKATFDDCRMNSSLQEYTSVSDYNEWLDIQSDLYSNKDKYKTMYFANALVYENSDSGIRKDLLSHLLDTVPFITEFDNRVAYYYTMLLRACFRRNMYGQKEPALSETTLSSGFLSSMIKMLYAYRTFYDYRGINTWTNTWMTIFAHAKYEDIIKSIKAVGFLDPMVFSSESNNPAFSRTYIDNLDEVSLNNMIHVFNKIINLEIANNFIVFVVDVLPSVILHKRELSKVFLDINFKSLNEVDYLNDDKLCQLVLLLLSPNPVRAIEDIVNDFYSMKNLDRAMNTIFIILSNTKFIYEWTNSFVEMFYKNRKFKVSLSDSSIQQYYNAVKMISEVKPILEL
ncbi:hypothetical protein [uncultured Spirosoma sp.]|uniref:NACHT domain-containing protein n=1 Tax=uncultured Spirosoma sp. TaxID=278208 RepID=UPI00258F7EEB|nr:hypothetical protein [uncultured Spirosoma sp.]